MQNLFTEILIQFSYYLFNLLGIGKYSILCETKEAWLHLFRASRVTQKVRCSIASHITNTHTLGGGETRERNL